MGRGCFEKQAGEKGKQPQHKHSKRPSAKTKRPTSSKKSALQSKPRRMHIENKQKRVGVPGQLPGKNKKRYPRHRIWIVLARDSLILRRGPFSRRPVRLWLQISFSRDSLKPEEVYSGGGDFALCLKQIVLPTSGVLVLVCALSSVTGLPLTPPRAALISVGAITNSCPCPLKAQSCTPDQTILILHIAKQLWVYLLVYVFICVSFVKRPRCAYPPLPFLPSHTYEDIHIHI